MLHYFRIELGLHNEVLTVVGLFRVNLLHHLVVH